MRLPKAKVMRLLGNVEKITLINGVKGNLCHVLHFIK